MKIPFYSKNGDLCGYIDHPDQLENYVPDGDTSNFHIKIADLDKWKFVSLIAGIKAEAARRILAVASLEKQINAAQRANVLLDIWRIKGEWTQNEQTEHDALLSGKKYIDHIRAKSNEIEKMDPIPKNFNDDEFWI